MDNVRAEREHKEADPVRTGASCRRDGQIADAVVLLSALAMQGEQLGSALVDAIPGMTEDALYELIDYTK